VFAFFSYEKNNSQTAACFKKILLAIHSHKSQHYEWKCGLTLSYSKILNCCHYCLGPSEIITQEGPESDFFTWESLGDVHKRRPQSGGLSSGQCRHFEDKGIGVSSDADVRTFWCKNFGSFEIYGVSARTRELSQCGHFSNKVGGGVNFSRFCADIFYGRPLTEQSTQTVPVTCSKYMYCRNLK